MLGIDLAVNGLNEDQEETADDASPTADLYVAERATGDAAVDLNATFGPSQFGDRFHWKIERSDGQPVATGDFKNSSSLGNKILTPTDTARDFIVTAWLDANNDGIFDDGEAKRVVNVHLLWVDLALDSDNDGSLTAADDASEDDPAKPGKIIPINDDDTDGDGIVDWADGFDSGSTDDPENDVIAGEQFVPLTLTLPQGLDFSKVSIRFDYDASNPNDVTWDGTTYILPAGSLRLWTKNGNEPRGRLPVSATGGSYIDKGGQGYTAAQLGLSDSNRTVTLWVEAVRHSTNLADLPVKVSIDPDGATNGDNFIAMDSVRLTAIGTRIVEPDETGRDTRPAQGGTFSDPSPTLTINYFRIENVRPSPDGLRLLGTIRISGTVDSAVADVVAGDLGKIDRVDIYLNGGLLPIGASVTPDLAQPGSNIFGDLVVTKESDPNSFIKPYDFSATFTTTILDVELQPGSNTLTITAADKVYGVSGYASASVDLTVTAATNPPPVDPYGNRIFSPDDRFSLGDFQLGERSDGGKFNRYLVEVLGPASLFQQQGYVQTEGGYYRLATAGNGKYYLSRIVQQINGSITATEAHWLPSGFNQRIRLADLGPRQIPLDNGMTEVAYSVEGVRWTYNGGPRFIGKMIWENLGNFSIVVPDAQAEAWCNVIRSLYDNIRAAGLHADLKADELTVEAALRLVPYGNAAIAWNDEGWQSGLKVGTGETILYVTPTFMCRPVRVAGVVAASGASIAERPIVLQGGSILCGGTTEVATNFGRQATFLDGSFTSIGNPRVAALPTEGFSTSTGGATMRVVGETTELGKGELFVNGFRAVAPGQAAASAATGGVLRLADGASELVASTVDDILLGVIEETGQMRLFVPRQTINGVYITGHADLVRARAIMDVGVQGFSIGVKNGKLSFLYKNSYLNDALADNLLSPDRVQQILGLLPTEAGCRVYP